MAEDRCAPSIAAVNASGTLASLASHPNDGPDPFTIKLVLENCNEGDVIQLEPGASAGAKQLCDFSKSVSQGPNGSVMCVLRKRPKT